MKIWSVTDGQRIDEPHEAVVDQWLAIAEQRNSALSAAVKLQEKLNENPKLARKRDAVRAAAMAEKTADACQEALKMIEAGTDFAALKKQLALIANRASTAAALMAQANE